MRPRIGGRRVPLLVSLVLVLLAGTVAPVQAAWNGRFSIWRESAFAPQYTDWSCVGATIQIMINLVDRNADRSRRNQFAYLDYAQQNSRYPVRDRGADPQGWADALKRWGAGDDWGVHTSDAIEDALYTAAQQIRQTGKPVGLLVHFGRHAWVMSGFEATADPAETDDFTVTAAEVVGPLWPSGTLNGRRFDPGPRTWQDVRTLGRKFDKYAEPDSPAWQGKWVTVIPRASLAVGAPRPTEPEPPTDAPDMYSVGGWTSMFSALAHKMAVRDLLWLR